MHILLVDDEPHVIRLMKMALERAGHQVDCALDGRAALEQLRARPPDVLITDVQMPIVSGKELCQRIAREMPERRFLIFVLTSRTDIEHREWSRVIPNLCFMEKPVSIRKLTARIKDYEQRVRTAKDRQIAS